VLRLLLLVLRLLLLHCAMRLQLVHLSWPLPACQQHQLR
jgi:hypothetical protein